MKAAITDSQSVSTQQNSAAAVPVPWRLIATEAAKIWLVWQAILLALTYFALTFTTSAQTHPQAPVATPATLISAWVRHDSAWYIGIATHGYTTLASSAFFPLYPLLIRLVTPLAFGNASVAAFVVARLAEYGVCAGVLALAWQELGHRLPSARLALAITLVYPLSLFLSAAYAESLLLCCAAFALLFLRRHAWGWAALAALLAALAHPRGFVLFVPLAWEWVWTERPWLRWRTWATWRGGVLALGAVPAAFVLLAGFIWLPVGGSPFSIARAEALYGHVSLAPWYVFRLMFGIFHRSAGGSFAQAHNLSDVGLVMAFAVVIAIGAWRRALPASLALYSAALVVLAVASPVPDLVDPFVSAGRYMVVAVPVFVMLALWAERRPWLTWLLIGGGLAVQVVLAGFFLTGGWVV